MELIQIDNLEKKSKVKPNTNKINFKIQKNIPREIPDRTTAPNQWRQCELFHPEMCMPRGKDG